MPDARESLQFGGEEAEERGVFRRLEEIARNSVES